MQKNYLEAAQTYKHLGVYGSAVPSLRAGGAAYEMLSAAALNASKEEPASTVSVALELDSRFKQINLVRHRSVFVINLFDPILSTKIRFWRMSIARSSVYRPSQAAGSHYLSSKKLIIFGRESSNVT